MRGEQLAQMFSLPVFLKMQVFSNPLLHTLHYIWSSGVPFHTMV